MQFTFEIDTVGGLAAPGFVDALAEVVYADARLVDATIAANHDGSLTLSFGWRRTTRRRRLRSRSSRSPLRSALLPPGTTRNVSYGQSLCCRRFRARRYTSRPGPRGPTA